MLQHEAQSNSRSIATTILSLKGKAKAATAAMPATPAETRRSGLLANEHPTPNSARMPAKPKPHSMGMEWAKAIPNRLAACQLLQLKKLPPPR